MPSSGRSVEGFRKLDSSKSSRFSYFNLCRMIAAAVFSFTGYVSNITFLFTTPYVLYLLLAFMSVNCVISVFL